MSQHVMGRGLGLVDVGGTFGGTTSYSYEINNVCVCVLKYSM